MLEQAGVVSRARVGWESRYSAHQEILAEAMGYLETAPRQWDEAIGRLQRLVEE